MWIRFLVSIDDNIAEIEKKVKQSQHSSRRVMHKMCGLQLYGEAKKEYDSYMKPIALPYKRNVCYVLQRMSSEILTKNLGTALKMNLREINFSLMLKNNSCSSYQLFCRLKEYNHTVLRYSLNLCSHELVGKTNDIMSKCESDYDELGELSKLDELLVYLDSFPPIYHRCIYRNALKNNGVTHWKNVCLHLNDIHESIDKVVLIDKVENNCEKNEII